MLYIYIQQKMKQFAYFYMKKIRSEKNAFVHIYIWKITEQKMSDFWVFHYKKAKYKENEAFLHISIWKRQNLMKMTHLFCIFDYDKDINWKNCCIFLYNKILKKICIFHISVLKRTKMTNVWVFQYFLYWNTQKLVIFLFCYFSYRNVHKSTSPKKMAHFWKK